MENNISNLKIEIGNNPVNFDLAIVSINQYGTLGQLNSSILTKYGYDLTEVDNIDVKAGYNFFRLKSLKPILFIVTVGNVDTKTNLERNLNNGIENNLKILTGKKVWLPLMGTGAGGLDFQTSYEITKNVINKYLNSIQFVVSIPRHKKGVEFFETYKNNILTPNKKDNNILDKLKEKTGIPNYFVADYLWGKENQILRFIENNIWENSPDRANIYAINTVKENDIIILKSTFEKNKTRFLSIRAIGVAFNNKNDGHNLGINWYKFNNQINIEYFGKYWKSFTKIDTRHINEILQSILKFQPDLVQIINNLKETKPVQKPEIKTNTITIAGLTSDADSGTDHLDIKKDVDAFAKVMAAKSFNPPLAIALLGKWGSGKSFFMRKLKERIQSLSTENNASKAYCGGIAHVHFNAWSYMDANLWAGIITKIFEGLQEYISTDTLAKLNKKEIEKKLTRKLNIAHDELKNLEQKQKSITNKIETLESQKGEAEASLKSKIDKIKHKSLKSVLENLDKEFKISEKVTDTLGKNESFNKSVETFNKIVPKEYWQNPKELYEKTKSIYAYTRAFFKGTTWKSNLTWIALIAIIVILIKGIVFFGNYYLLEKDFSFSIKTWSYITIVSGFIIRNIQTIKQLQPIIASFYKIKEDYELQKKDLIFKVNQTEKALKLEIENHKNEIQSISQQIHKAQQSKAEIEYRLENTLTTEALFSFIEKRADSNDYKKHLGIVSIIRKDFEILSELFSGHNDELKKPEESKEFQEQFERPLERIILYIDDLDRCPNDRVIEVLEAVNLLMAYPLFVVVVGVDPRWVQNALDEKYSFQFNNKNKNTIEPSGYLEKIFQIPFQLKSATDANVKIMLKKLAETSPIIGKTENKTSKENKNTSNSRRESTNEQEETSKGTSEKDPEKTLKGTPEKPKKNNKDVIKSLKFSDKEIEILQSMSSILGTNPRALKRFVNIYRVIKAHEDFNYTDEKQDLEIQTVMFLIALPIGKYRKLYAPFSKMIKNEHKDETLATYLLAHTFKSSLEDSDKIRNLVLESLREELYIILKSISNSFLSQKTADFKAHYIFIKRFTFNNL